MSRTRERMERRKKAGIYQDPRLSFGGYDSTKPLYTSPSELLHLTDTEVEESAQQYMREYHDVQELFQRETKLRGFDYKFLFLATAMQVIRQHIFTNNAFRIDAKEGDKWKHAVGKSIKNVSPDSMQDYLNIIFGPAPYDKTFGHLGGKNHRYETLGHDPLGGWIFGTLNFATKTLTLKDLSLTTFDVGRGQYMPVGSESMTYYKTAFPVVLKKGIEKFNNDPALLPVCVLAQAAHLGSDVFTKCGLPIPVINNIPSKEAALQNFLQTNNIDLYNVTRGAVLSEFINRCIVATHSLFCQPTDDVQLYQVRSMKIIIYSGLISSASNILETIFTRDVKRLDVGGILVTAWHFFRDRKKIKEIEEEFINKRLNDKVDAQIRELDEKIAFYERKLGILR